MEVTYGFYVIGLNVYYTHEIDANLISLMRGVSVLGRFRTFEQARSRVASEIQLLESMQFA